MKVSVIIPTYKRTQDLSKCLIGLSEQTKKPDEIIVIIRNSDNETKGFIQNFHCPNTLIKTYFIDRPGVVAALNKGLNKARFDIVAFLDDDAVPTSSWIEKLVNVYKDNENIGGVGGKDNVYHGENLLVGRKNVVGKVQWFGRVIGFHHLGGGSIRDVDVLKGVNMSFRRKAIINHGFDERLLGEGAQVGNELALSLAVKRDGWKLVYDPSVQVNHYPAQRFDEDQRYIFNDLALYNNAFNDTIILLEHYKKLYRKLIFIIWAILVGTKDKPGMLQWLRLLLKNEKSITLKFYTCIKARIDGWITSKKYQI